MPFINTVDGLITFRIIKMLVTPWSQTQAYHLGIIDADGNPLKKSEDLKTSQEQAAYTILDRLVFKIKRLLQNIPIVSRNLTNFAAALWLVKECYNNQKSPENLDESFEWAKTRTLDIEREELKAYMKEHPNFILHKAMMNEDGASAGGAPAGGEGPSIGNIANNAGDNKIAGFAGDAGRKTKLMKKVVRRKSPGEPSNITSPLA